MTNSIGRATVHPREHRSPAMPDRSFVRAFATMGTVGALLLVVTGPLLAEQKAQEAYPKWGILLYSANADGSKMKQLTDVPGYARQGSPCWSQDGKMIAFDALTQQAAENGDHNQANIVVVNADGSNPRVLLDGAMPSFSPAGKRIAFSRYYPNRGVWVMSVEGPDRELVMLDETGWGADWSPDGTKIVYATHTSGGANFVIFDLVEGDRRFLFPEENPPFRALYWNFTWSPDSKQIVFKGLDINEKNVVGIVDARGSEHGLVSRIEEGILTSFAWRPDGGRILISKKIAQEPCRQMYFVDPTLKSPAQRLPGQMEVVDNDDMAYSPDGARLVVASRLSPPVKPQANAEKQSVSQGK